MNKFMKKIMSKKDGFTLVELIVVIAILAILAGVAVPVYSGYIKNANEGADIAALDAYKTAAQAALIKVGKVDSVEITTNTVTATIGNTVYVLAGTVANNNNDDYADEFAELAGTGFTYTFKQSGIVKATWDPTEAEVWDFSEN